MMTDADRAEELSSLRILVVDDEVDIRNGLRKLLSRLGARLRVAAAMLVGQALNLYIQIAPPVLGPEPRLGPFELGPLLGGLALFAWGTLHALSRAPIVPVADPWLESRGGGGSARWPLKPAGPAGPSW